MPKQTESPASSAAPLVVNFAEWGVHKHGYTIRPFSAFISTPGLPLFVDVETTEDDHRQLVGACVLVPGATSIYWVRTEEDFTLLRKAISASSGVCGHNVKFDLKVLMGHGFDGGIPRVVDDTMILAYSVSSVLPSFGLKDLAKQFCGLVWPSYKDIVGKGRKKLTLDKQPEDLVMNYCAMDVLASYKLRNALLDVISTEHKYQYEAIELPTYNALLSVEAEGVRVNATFLQQLSDTWGKEAAELKAQMVLKFGDTFNPASPKQVVAQFNSVYGLGLESSAKSSLLSWKTNEMVSTLLRYRAVAKLKATYADALLERAPIIRCTFNQVVNDEHGSSASDGIDTTRLSSSNPNLQNIPARTAEGELVRRAFVPREGKVFIVADYSQIEYRLLAHFSDDPVLFKAYADGVDIHKQTASIIYSVSIDAVTDQQRDLAKTINFAAIYGAGSKKIAGLTDKTPEECQKFLNVYFDKLPGVRRFVQITKTQAHIKGYTKTLLGRRIDLPGIRSTDKFEVFSAERKAVNYKIQGSAAELMKLALIRLVDEGFQVLLTVHDEFVIETTPEKADEDIKAVSSIMCSVVDLKVPLVANIGKGESWADAKV